MKISLTLFFGSLTIIAKTPQNVNSAISLKF